MILSSKTNQAEKKAAAIFLDNAKRGNVRSGVLSSGKNGRPTRGTWKEYRGNHVKGEAKSIIRKLSKNKNYKKLFKNARQQGRIFNAKYQNAQFLKNTIGAVRQSAPLKSASKAIKHIPYKDVLSKAGKIGFNGYVIYQTVDEIYNLIANPLYKEHAALRCSGVAKVGIGLSHYIPGSESFMPVIIVGLNTLNIYEAGYSFKNGLISSEQFVDQTLTNGYSIGCVGGAVLASSTTGGLSNLVIPVCPFVGVGLTYITPDIAKDFFQDTAQYWFFPEKMTPEELEAYREGIASYYKSLANESRSISSVKLPLN